MLAILDLLDRGLITRNEFPLSPDVAKTFKRYFDAVRQGDDQPAIENPFYHLSGDGFWQLVTGSPNGIVMWVLTPASRLLPLGCS